MNRGIFVVFAVLVITDIAFAQKPDENLVLLREIFDSNSIIRVQLKTSMSGRLGLATTPAANPKTDSPPVTVTGSSTLTYDERPLVADEEKAARSLRIYRDVQIQRLIGDREQKADIRPEVRRLVVMRSDKGKKAPFSPDGPLTWNEIDLVRTDTFSQSLVNGLLPGKPVRPGDQWKASAAAIAELTEIDRVDEGGITIEFANMVTVNQKRTAKLVLFGTIKGANEDGPTRQKLDGTAYFDLTSDRLTYLKLSGVHELLGKDGQVTGRLEGSYTLTREASTKAHELNDVALRGVDLKATAENTLLLYDNPVLGVSFRYPRRWRVGVVQGSQITLDEPDGGGILLTVLPVRRTPSASDYRKEVLRYLEGQKWKVLGGGDIRSITEKPARLDRFSIDAEMSSVKVRLEYAVLATGVGGVTLAARLPSADAAELTADFERVLKHFSIREPGMAKK